MRGVAQSVPCVRDTDLKCMLFPWCTVGRPWLPACKPRAWTQTSRSTSPEGIHPSSHPKGTDWTKSIRVQSFQCSHYVHTENEAKEWPKARRKSWTFGFEASNQSLILEDSQQKILFGFLFLCKSLEMFTFWENIHMQTCTETSPLDMQSIVNWLQSSTCSVSQPLLNFIWS